MLVANRVRVVGDPKIVGDRKNHLQVRFAQGETTLKAIGWNMADRGKALKSGTLCSVAFHPSINDWQGRRTVEMELKDFRLEEEGHAQSA